VSIYSYESLLVAAKEQPEPQRLLFVFLKASLPEDAVADEEASFHEGEGGTLTPVMCVDKVLDELGSFADLVEESNQISEDWQIVLVASLTGRNGVAPTPNGALEPLKLMVKTVETGGDLSNFLAFDREGEPIQFG
jgi:hypothetical protein